MERKAVGGKIRNFLKDPVEDKNTPVEEHRVMPAEDEPWSWEGNVQDTAAKHLKERGYSIIHIVDTRRKEKGKDIEAENQAGLLWVTVKGYPKGTLKTRPSIQAGHWFKDATFDIVSWREESKDAVLAMALPDFPRYRSLAEKVRWLQSVAGFAFIWVGTNGEVTVEGDLKRMG